MEGEPDWTTSEACSIATYTDSAAPEFMYVSVPYSMDKPEPKPSVAPAFTAP